MLLLELLEQRRQAVLVRIWQALQVLDHESCALLAKLCASARQHTCAGLRCSCQFSELLTRQAQPVRQPVALRHIRSLQARLRAWLYQHIWVGGCSTLDHCTFKHQASVSARLAERPAAVRTQCVVCQLQDAVTVEAVRDLSQLDGVLEGERAAPGL